MSPRGRIGRFGRVGRRPDYWSSPHERARNRAAERLEAPLAAREAAWLETHLADCEPCRAIAEAYAADRLALRQLRDVQPEPPRDLWARTAAGIEREAARQRGVRAGGTGAERRRQATSRPALGVLSGLSVVAVVVIATAISGGFLGRVGLDATGPNSSIALASQAIAEPTAMAVGAGRVQWLGTGEDGAFAYNVADIDVVCARDRQPDCAPFADGDARRVALNATPRFVFQSPVADQAVVVGTDANGADAVLIVALPAPDPTPTVAPDMSPATATEPAGSPAASHEASATAVPPTVAPSEVLATSVASLDPNASGSIGPDPSDATAVAIITDVTIVGRASSFSPDGAWFAFSARPADGSAGPDIYVWHVGELQARALTTDHASVFASWVGGSIVGSRLSPDPDSSTESGAPLDPVAGTPPPDDASQAPDAAASAEPVPAPERMPETFLLDPWTGAEVALLAAEWQPAVDPTGLAVVAWQGTVGLDANGLTVAPATGNLVIHPFRGPLEFDEPTVSPSLPPDSPAALSPAPSTIDTPALSPQIVQDFPVQIVSAGPIADFDARWDETGSWLAIWIADPIDPELGRLSLLHFDPFTGFVDRPLGAPQDVTALPGFSIGYGRLAWASPPGQSGEGSRIQIAAWALGEVGAVESVPVVGAIVVQ